MGPNQNGEIRFKSPAVMKGYIGLDTSAYLDKEGFYKSGDYGYYDDDGCLFIVSRMKELIKYDAYPVSIKDICRPCSLNIFLLKQILRCICLNNILYCHLSSIAAKQFFYTF